ncbi:Mur ligase family protein [Indiicoccus explosivorum]|uniref:Mur ligase family protein n=1 Tax=Indiicoccus explosivorum TaxID=1917864 RepID=UPI001F4E6FA3|nr:UDP-N-acetylmuramoyl-L-alanyl-D-glutamate--2,6-diaminopimelate ligase [Indiicoccus explosivorum]
MNIQFDSGSPIKPIVLQGPDRQNIVSAVYNSADAVPGAAFFCIHGEKTDGHLYIQEALDHGAKAVIGSDESAMDAFAPRYPEVTFALVEDVREAMAQAAIMLSGGAQERLLKVGVTGTNGKTTVASYIRNLLNLTGIPCGFIGTNGVWTSGSKMTFRKTTPTTPLSADLHRIFSMLDEQGNKAVSMEVTSIAIDQRRVAGIEFDVAVHTNLSEEHLEYHGTIDHYRNAKLELFRQAKAAVVNLDDEGMAGEILAEAACPILTVSQQPSSGADLVWTNCEGEEDGMAFDLIWQGIRHSVTMPLFAEYNVGNMALAIGALLQAGIPFSRIKPVLPDVDQVEGRFQRIEGPDGRKIIIDYAHTPIALDKVLEAANKLPHNRLIALIAGIGIRDFGKMPKMAKAAEGKADMLVVTVDHPGDHDPSAVVEEVMKGFTFPYKQEVRKAMTRREAVETALRESGPNDLILLTSGCINGAQIVKGEYVPHSDEEIIEEFFLSQS